MPSHPVMEEQMSQPEPSPIVQTPASPMPETALDASAGFSEMVKEWASSVGKLLEDLPAGMEASDWTPPEVESGSPDEVSVAVGAAEPAEEDGPLQHSLEAGSDGDAARLTLSLPEIDVQDLLDEVQSLIRDL